MSRRGDRDRLPQKRSRGTPGVSTHWWAVATAAAWRCRAAHRWCGRRRTRSCKRRVRAVAIGRAVVATIVLAVAVEELDLPVAVPLGKMRFDGDDLTLDCKHFGDGAPGQRVQLRPRRRQQERP